MSEEDARRIAACVNACAGLDLPDGVPLGVLQEVVDAARRAYNVFVLAALRLGEGTPAAYYMGEIQAAIRAALIKLGSTP